MRFAGQVAIVTGATRGIGLATARGFVRDGGSVLMNFASDEAAAAAALDAVQRVREGAASIYRADVGDPEAVHAMVDDCLGRFGRIDVLVNNAAHTVRAPFAEVSPEEWQRTRRVNVDGAFHCAREVVPHMIRAGRGAIVNVSSIGVRTGRSSSVAYATSKGALIAFARALATELAPSGVRINAVLPGVTDTEGHRLRTDEDAISRIAQVVPLGRAARPDEIAAAILFLCSDEASYITGAAIEIAGGR